MRSCCSGCGPRGELQGMGTNIWLFNGRSMNGGWLMAWAGCLGLVLLCFGLLQRRPRANAWAALPG